MYALRRAAGTAGAHRKPRPPTAATIAPSVKARKRMTVVRRRRASTALRWARRARSAEATAPAPPGRAPRSRRGSPTGGSRRSGRSPRCSGASGRSCGAVRLSRARGTADSRWPVDSPGAARGSVRASAEWPGSAPGASSSMARWRSSLAYRRSMADRPDSSRMAVLKRSVGRASLSSSCLRSHIGTK